MLEHHKRGQEEWEQVLKDILVDVHRRIMQDHLWIANEICKGDHHKVKVTPIHVEAHQVQVPKVDQATMRLKTDTVLVMTTEEGMDQHQLIILVLPHEA